MNMLIKAPDKIKPLAVFCAMAAISFFSLAAGAADIKTVVKKVIERNYGLKQAQAFSQQAEQENKFAGRQLYPKASFEMSLVRSDDPVFSFGSYLRQERFTQANFDIGKLNRPGPTDDFTASVSVGVPIYTAGKLSYGIKTAKTHAAQAGQQEIMARKQVIFQVLELCFSAACDKNIMSAAAETEKAAQSELKDAANLASRGMSLGAEYYGAVAVKHGISAKRIEAENGYDNAVSALAVMAGEDKKYFEFGGAMTEKEYPVPALETLIDNAASERNDVNIARLEHSALKDTFEVEKNSILPSVQAFGKIQTDSYEMTYMPEHYTVGVQLTMPFFDPARGARIDMAERRYKQADAKVSSIGEQTVIEVTNAYNDYRASGRALNEMKNSKEQALKSVKMMRVLHRQGRVSAIDMLRAEDQLLSAQSAFYKTVYNMNMAYVSLMAVSGMLSFDTVRTINDLSGEVRQ